MAVERKIPVVEVERTKLDDLADGIPHQGVAAMVPTVEYSTLDDIFALAEKRNEKPLIVIADDINDPHNLGAIIRSAEGAGAHGVIIPKNRAVGLTATVARTSAGALSHIPVARVTNMVRTIEEFKEKGMWFACADMDGDLMYRCDMTGSFGLVIGAEGKGVSRLVKEKCDFTVKIPMYGPLDSLNASVAAGVLAYESVRQRIEKEKK
jgi:23S rRNA (guanosine2251-2'-O)-methyltransferase